MSDNFNIRDFRNTGATDEGAGTEKSNRAFYTSVIAIPIIAAVAGLGYKPMMEFRNNNAAAVQAAELNVEAKRRAENPLYALKQDMRNSDGLIDSSRLLNTGAAPSPEAKLRKEYAQRSLSAREFLNRVDAKALGFNAMDMETLKYTRTQSALNSCKHYDLRKFYTRSNEEKYKALKEKGDVIKAQQRGARAAETNKLALPDIENKTQALAFVASGGAARHQAAAMNTFGSLSNMDADMGKMKAQLRQQRFNKTGCMQVRTIVQSGAMNIKTNIRLPK